MRLHQQNPFTAFVVGAALIAGVSCSGDRAPTGPRLTPPGANAVLSDGTTSGNANVFFLPPLVSSPVGVGNYGKTPFQAALPVEIEIVCIAPSVNCTNQGMRRKAMTQSQSDEHYMFNWDTRAPGFDAGNTFSVNIWIQNTKVAYAEVVLIPNSNPKNKKDLSDIPLQDGRTVPIKVHVQQGWGCADKTNVTSCVTQAVTNTPPAGQQYTVVKTADGRDALAFPRDWFDPAAVNKSQVMITIEDVSDLLKSSGGCRQGLTVMTSVEHCIRVTTDPANVILQQNVLASTCVDRVLSLPGGVRQLLMKYDVGEEPLFLRVDPEQQLPITCLETTSTSHSPNPLVRFAANTWSRVTGAVSALIGVKTAYAIDIGVGGSLDAGGPCCSLFTLGFPVSMSAVSPALQPSAPVGTIVNETFAVRLRALHTNGQTPSTRVTPDDGAQVTCTPDAGSGSVASSGVATYNVELDRYECPSWRLGALGTNTMRVSAARIDNTVQIEMDPMPDDEGSSCNNVIEVAATSDGGGEGTPPAPLPQTCRRYNGAVVFTATGLQGPDLVLDRALTMTPTTVDAGSTVQLNEFFALNTGNAASGPVVVRLILSASRDLSNPILQTDLTTDGGIPAGGSARFGPQSVSIPSSTQTGTYYVGLLVDPANVIQELNESNNGGVAVFLVNGPPVIR